MKTYSTATSKAIDHPEQTHENSQEIKLWDPLVRGFHWSLASLFFVNFFITEDGGDIHEWVGYLCVGLIGIRLLWSLISRGNANIRHLIPTKKGIQQHLNALFNRRIDPYEGHNPLGALMIITLLSLIMLLGITGYILENVDMFWGSEWLEELHEALANITLFAVFCHVSAIILLQKWGKIELIRPMVTGKRRLK